MSFETDLRTRLINDATVVGIVGTRIYWEIRPQDSALPAIVLHTVNGSRAQSLAGAMETQGNQIQFDCMAVTKADAVALRQAVIAVAEVAGTAGSTEFQGGNVDLYRGIVEDTAAGVIRTEQVRATIWFN